MTALHRARSVPNVILNRVPGYARLRVEHKVSRLVPKGWPRCCLMLFRLLGCLFTQTFVCSLVLPVCWEQSTKREF